MSSSRTSPWSPKVARSRASATGSHATYATARGCAAAIACNDGSPRAGPRRVEHDEVDPLQCARPRHPAVDRGAHDRHREVPGVLGCQLAGASITLDQRDLDSPGSPGEAHPEEADARVQVHQPLAVPRVEHAAHMPHEGVRGAGVHLPEAVRCDRPWPTVSAFRDRTGGRIRLREGERLAHRRRDESQPAVGPGPPEEVQRVQARVQLRALPADDHTVGAVTQEARSPGSVHTERPAGAPTEPLGGEWHPRPHPDRPRRRP